jgi:hypothetical protein
MLREENQALVEERAGFTRVHRMLVRLCVERAGVSRRLPRVREEDGRRATPRSDLNVGRDDLMVASFDVIVVRDRPSAVREEPNVAPSDLHVIARNAMKARISRGLVLETRGFTSGKIAKPAADRRLIRSARSFVWFKRIVVWFARAVVWSARGGRLVRSRRRLVRSQFR